MSIYQILLSFILGSGLFAIHMLIRKISPKFKAADDKLSKREIQIIKNQISVFYNNISKISFISPILNNYGYLAVSNKEISRVYAAAPPTAPPASEIIPALLPSLFDDLSQENSDFSKPAIQNYISEKLVTKSKNYPDLFKFEWSKLDFFEKRLKFEIQQFFLNICRNDSTSGKVEPSLAAAREALSCSIVNIDASINDAGDGKPTTFHDLIGTTDDEPLQTLIKAERAAAENTALNKLTELQKSRLIQQFDDQRRSETGELFEVETVAEPVKPGNPNKYRRRSVPLTAAQPQLFGGAL